MLGKDAVDINVSPDKRTLFLHSEDKLVLALKVYLPFFLPLLSVLA